LDSILDDIRSVADTVLQVATVGLAIAGVVSADAKDAKDVKNGSRIGTAPTEVTTGKLFVEYEIALFDPDIREFSDDSTDYYLGTGEAASQRTPITGVLSPFDGAVGTLGSKVTIDEDAPAFNLSFREPGIYEMSMSSALIDGYAALCSGQAAPVINALNGTALAYNFETQEYNDAANYQFGWSRLTYTGSAIHYGGSTMTAIVSISDPSTDTVDFLWDVSLSFGFAVAANYSGSLLITKLDSSAVSGTRIPLSQRASCPGLRASHGVIEAYHNKRRAERGVMLTRAINMTASKKKADRKDQKSNTVPSTAAAAPQQLMLSSNTDDKSDGVLVTPPPSATAVKAKTVGSSKNGWFK